MNVGQFVVAFLSDLIVTVFAYGLGPIILLKLHKGPISIKKLKWFHIIYTIIISFSFNVILLLLELRPVSNFTPALIWGTVFYRFNKKKFAQREKAIPPETYTQQEAQMKQFAVDDATGEVISEPPAEDPKPITLEYHPDFQLQGPPKDPKPPAESPDLTQKPAGKSYAPLCIILGILLAASFAGNVVQSYMSVNKLEEMTFMQDKLQTEVNSLRSRVSSLRKEKNQLNEQLSNMQYGSDIQDEIIDRITPEAFAMETYIGFIYDGSQYCHSYNCPNFPFDDCADNGFYAHNVEYCEWLGYPKHSGCWD
nr:MAG TPA: cell division protein [Caudoviricetes sp.]